MDEYSGFLKSQIREQATLVRKSGEVQPSSLKWMLVSDIITIIIQFKIGHQRRYPMQMLWQQELYRLVTKVDFRESMAFGTPSRYRQTYSLDFQWPSRPSLPHPKERTSPLSLRMLEWMPPAETLLTLQLIVSILRGYGSSAASQWLHLLACPSFPLYPAPHVQTSPASLKAILWEFFSPLVHETCTIFTSASFFINRGSFSSILLLWPNWQKVPVPHEYVAPFWVTAKAWLNPAAALTIFSQLMANFFGLLMFSLIL